MITLHIDGDLLVITKQMMFIHDRDALRHTVLGECGHGESVFEDCGECGKED